MRTLPPVTVSFFDDAPFRVATVMRIRTTPDRVFATLADPSSWPRWFPLMSRAAWTSSQTGCVGAEREVAVRAFGQFRERFIAWEPGKRFSFTMLATTSPLVDAMAEDYRLTAADGGTRLDWILATRPTRLGRAAQPALRVILHRISAAAARGLDRYTRAN